MRTVQWKGGNILLVDQQKLPEKLEHIRIRDIKALRRAIRSMKVRGAPALGAAAALGICLGVKYSKAKDFSAFSRELDRVSRYLAASRPTARNLFWAIERMCSIAVVNRKKPVGEIKNLLLKEARKIIEEDRIICRKIGAYGARMIKKNDSVLTICNTGMLATIDYGTALGVVYSAHKAGKAVRVFACETRPMLQGARLTTWELRRKNIDVTLICDSMAAGLMRQGKIDKVIVGADRIASNGDFANKVGTYNLAVLARYHHVPFYVAAPESTFDLSIPEGKSIPIEQRDALEVTHLFFHKPIAAKGAKVLNPAFDVTPHPLISAIITDKGMIFPPYIRNIRKVLGSK